MAPSAETKGTKRAVNLSLDPELVRRARERTDNLSGEVERLLGEYLEAEDARRVEADARMADALAAWNALAERLGSLADEHSTL